MNDQKSSGPIVITGAFGYVGKKLCTALVERGYKIRVLVKGDQDDHLFFSSLKAEIFIGHARDKYIEERLLEGASGVFNLAGIFGRLGMLENEFWDANVTVTKRLLRAAAKTNVTRFVYCSTADVMGDVLHPPADEDTPTSVKDIYQLTKAHGELSSLSANGQKGMRSTVVRPTVVYGPGDMRRLDMFRDIVRGTYRLIGDGNNWVHPVYIDDLVEGMIQAYFSEKAAGRVYILGGEKYITLREWVDLIAREAGVQPPHLTIPCGPAKLFLVVCEKVFSFFRMGQPELRHRIDFCLKNRAYRIDRAVAELGYKPKVDLAEGTRRTLAWYGERGLI